MDEFKPLGAQEEQRVEFGRVGVEEVEAYWDRRPCNLFHSTAERGTRLYYDEVERRKYFVEPHIPAFASFPDWRGKRCDTSIHTLTCAFPVLNWSRVTAACSSWGAVWARRASTLHDTAPS
jgi:hypothetical protein